MIRTWVTLMSLACLVVAGTRLDAQHQRQEQPRQEQTQQQEQTQPQELPGPKQQSRQYWPKPKLPALRSQTQELQSQLPGMQPRNGTAPAQHSNLEPYRRGNRFYVIPSMRPRAPLPYGPAPVYSPHYRSYRPGFYGYGFPGYGQTIITGPSIPSYRLPPTGGSNYFGNPHASQYFGNPHASQYFGNPHASQYLGR